MVVVSRYRENYYENFVLQTIWKNNILKNSCVVPYLMKTGNKYDPRYTRRQKNKIQLNMKTEDKETNTKFKAFLYTNQGKTQTMRSICNIK